MTMLKNMSIKTLLLEEIVDIFVPNWCFKKFGISNIENFLKKSINSKSFSLIGNFKNIYLQEHLGSSVG